MLNFSNFFLEKMDFSGKKILLLSKNVKHETSPTSGGPSPPGPPAGGGVIAFKWPDRPPPEKILTTPLNRDQWCIPNVQEIVTW